MSLPPPPLSPSSLSFSPSEVSHRPSCWGRACAPPRWVQGPISISIAFCGGFPTVPAGEQGAHCSQTGCSASPDVPAALNGTLSAPLPKNGAPGGSRGAEAAFLAARLQALGSMPLILSSPSLSVPGALCCSSGSCSLQLVSVWHVGPFQHAPPPLILHGFQATKRAGMLPWV